MSRRVFLHVGTPKSGTSHLQDTFALNRDLLARQGLTYLSTRTGDHFEAALDLIGERWAGAEKDAAGQWEALVAEARRTPGDLLISHEILAAAPADRVRRATESFPDAEIHVVVTARDLGRQIPAEWQEQVKHRSRRAYTSFLTQLARTQPRTDDDRPWFWRVQSLPSVLTRWGTGLRPEQVHLVTVPPPGGSSDVLWERFAEVVGLDPHADHVRSETTNASLGGAEVTMLRRLNSQLAARKVPRDTYVTWVRETIVRDVLAHREGMQRAVVPPQRRPWVERVTEEWLDWISQSGVQVVGDLGDLRPVWPDEADWHHPDEADDALVADAAIEALAHVLSTMDTAPPASELGPVARIARRLRS